MPDLGAADAEGHRAERAVRARVAVAADDGLAGLGRADLRADDVHDAALVAVEAVQFDAESPAVFYHCPDLTGLRRRRDDIEVVQTS